MPKLNYHHLNYFWQVAKIGNLTKAAVELNISQSALSSQIKQLEESIGKKLFSRQNRKLVLTEIGNITFSYADSIFNKGEELEALIRNGIESDYQVIRIGMLSTMSRNFVEEFVKPLMDNPKLKLVIAARGQTNLLNELSNHEFDVVLTNIEVRGTNERLWQCKLLTQQAISIIGAPGRLLPKKFSNAYKSVNWVLPVSGSPIRSAFDGLCAQYQFQPTIVGEADDMAMLRLLARDSNALAVMPEVVVKDELNTGKLTSYMTLPNINENFFAVTVTKHIPNKLISDLIIIFSKNQGF
ncbi:MAG: LysR family transcriptional regulator [Methylotenera sp.]|nr:MAG: LysR family transcriptional regulator [Methylotenera sp.]